MNQSPSQALEHLSNVVAQHGHKPLWVSGPLHADLLKHYGGDGTVIAHPGTEQHFADGGTVGYGGPGAKFGPISPIPIGGDPGNGGSPTPMPPGQIPPHKIHPLPPIGGNPKMPPIGGGNPPLNPGQPPYTGGNPPMQPLPPPKPIIPTPITEPPMQMPPGNLSPGPLHFKGGGSVSANINKGDLAQAGWTPPGVLPGTTPGTTPNPGDGQAWQFANGGHGVNGAGSANFPTGGGMDQWGGGAFPGGTVTGWGTGNGQTAIPTYWGTSNGQSAGYGNGWYVPDGQGGLTYAGQGSAGGVGEGGSGAYGGGYTGGEGGGGGGSAWNRWKATDMEWHKGGRIPGDAPEDAPDTVPAMVKPGEDILNKSEQKSVELKKDWKKGLTKEEIKKVEEMRLKKKK